MSKLLTIALGAVLAGACAGQAPSGQITRVTEVQVTSPELMPLGNGVQVVADADEPVLFTANAYWLYRDGTWYRAPTYRGEWLTANNVPEQLRVIENQPQAYVHYRESQQQAGRTLQAHGPDMTPTEPGQPARPQQPAQPEPNRVPAPPEPEQQPYANPLPQPEPIDIDDPGTVDPDAVKPGTDVPDVGEPINAEPTPPPDL